MVTPHLCPRRGCQARVLAAVGRPKRLVATRAVGAHPAGVCAIMDGGAPGQQLSPTEEQEKWLHEAFKAVKQHAFYMKRALDESNLREALKHSAAMLGELRTSLLSPQKYYALYMKTFDELRHLEAFFAEENKRGRSNAELYEIVQHAGNILPRMYLLITVGSVYIKSKEGAAKDVLKDLVEMARGVQHPVRGLFLRTYLSQISKNLLPDTGSEYEGEGGNVQDAVDFILQNFTEMNKLWVRMQHQGPARDKDRREKERQELRDLVGKNLLVLSQLEGVDLELYQNTVLPRILEQVVNCKDDIAQPYLMDAVIQVFPDEFHLQTLETLLAVCPQLQPNVKVGGVLAGLMTRLAKYAADVPEVVPQFQSADAFGKFSAAISKVVAVQPEMAAVDIVAMYSSLMAFALQVHREQLTYVDVVLAGCASALDSRGKVSESKATKQLVNLLTSPLDTYDVVSVLSLSSYPKVMDVLEHNTRKQMAVTIVRCVLKSGTIVQEVEQVDMLFEFISLLIKDDDAFPDTNIDEEDFEEEQNLVARLVHHLACPNSEGQYRVLLAARRHFGQGGPKRLRHTLPPLIFSGLQLVRQLHAQSADGEGISVALKKLFQFLHQTTQALAEIPRSEAALRLFLQCAQAASDCELEPVTYEFMERAYEIFEESIPDSKAQVTALQLIIGSLQRCTVFGTENRAALVHKATGYSAKLLKKPDQCRAVYTCAHLFWHDTNETLCDADSVLACLKRALKIANAAQQMATASRGDAGPVVLFVEILNKYLYFFDKGCEAVTPEVLQGLLQLIGNELTGDAARTGEVDAFHKATVQHIRTQQEKDGELAARYAAVSV